jgi:hypothetical protein|tara:strand:- start:142 stop:453 length:312 start_codon:yes stop_codon:yes gene_type:complete
VAKSWKDKIRKRYRNKWSSLFETLSTHNGLDLTTKAACVIWWDLWNDKEDFSDFRLFLDRYNKRQKEISESVSENHLANTLWRVGYPKKEAMRRSIQPKTTRR